VNTTFEEEIKYWLRSSLYPASLVNASYTGVSPNLTHGTSRVKPAPKVNTGDPFPPVLKVE
jgi:hypothetical protein